MSVKIKPENLKPVARLLAQFKPSKVTRSRSNPWNGLHRLVASEGRLRLLSTDGSSFLEWIISHEGTILDAFDMTVEADQFNNVALRLSDGDLISISSASGYLTLNQGQRNLRMPWQSAPAYPEPERKSGSPIEQPLIWKYPTSDLAKSLDFVAGYINPSNNSLGKDVATLNTSHELTGGGADKQASVLGLNATLTDLSLNQMAARQVSAFLHLLSDKVEVNAADDLYTFTCPLRFHRLIVPRAPRSLLKPLGFVANSDYEQFEVDREELTSSISFLATVVTAKAKPLEFRVRGRGEGASLRIMTPFQLEADKSEDTLPIVRTFHRVGDSPDPEGGTPATPVDEIKLLVNAEPLRGILSSLEGKIVFLKFFPRKKLILIEEDSRERTGIRRLVTLLVGTICEPTKELVEEDNLSTTIEASDAITDLQEPSPELLVGAAAVHAGVEGTSDRRDKRRR